MERIIPNAKTKNGVPIYIAGMIGTDNFGKPVYQTQVSDSGVCMILGEDEIIFTENCKD